MLPAAGSLTLFILAQEASPSSQEQNRQRGYKQPFWLYVLSSRCNGHAPYSSGIFAVKAFQSQFPMASAIRHSSECFRIERLASGRCTAPLNWYRSRYVGVSVLENQDFRDAVLHPSPLFVTRAIPPTLHVADMHS